jgi:pentatricopeptide repeat protein
MKLSCRLDGSIRGALGPARRQPIISTLRFHTSRADLTDRPSKPPSIRSWARKLVFGKKKNRSVWNVFRAWLGWGKRPATPPKLFTPSVKFSASLAEAVRIWAIKHRTPPRQQPPKYIYHLTVKQRYAKQLARPRPRKASRKRAKQTEPVQHTRAYLLELVGATNVGPVNDYFDYHRDPYLRRYAQPDDGPNVRISDRSADVGYPSWEMATRGEPELERLHELLRTAVAERLYQPKSVSLDDLYRLYCKLPEPKMLSIAYPLRGQLLRVYGAPGMRDARSMLRYFALVGDVKKAGLPLRLREWNFAISLASRYVRRTTKTELVTAMQLWKEMENDQGILANEVTFNILFDVASKANDFNLAEEVYKEMEARGIPFNRYHHVSMIHFFGLKQDGDGVRAAYREMVEDGEIVDTVVLNCVIAGLTRAGEHEAAAEIYERMKSASNEAILESPSGHRLPAAVPPPPQNSRGGNRLSVKVLMMYGRLSKKHPEMSQQLQASTSLAPDLQTVRILTEHFGARMGDLSRMMHYLDDMSGLGLPLQGGIFSIIFRGFVAHGGVPGSEWSEEKLHRVFQTLLDAVDSGVDGLHIRLRLAMQVVHAFQKCSSAEATRWAHEQVVQRMKLTVAQEGFLAEVLRKALVRRDWRPRYQQRIVHGKRKIHNEAQVRASSSM